MKRSFKYLSSFIITCLCCVALISCNKEEPREEECSNICPICQKCMDKECTQEGHEVKCGGHSGSEVKDPDNEIHVIKDNKGNYGGTLNKTKYGEGAPLNGELDVENDIYYAKNDYFHTYSTDTRTMIPEFAVYQQTMANSDGIACALSLMAHDGVVDERDLDEQSLVVDMETMTGKKVYNNGNTAQQLVDFLGDFDYEAEVTTNTIPTNNAALSEYFADCINEDKYVLIGWQYGIKYQWFVVVGIDDMGNGYGNDDCIILANTFDASDHYQDGYTVQCMRRLALWMVKKNRSGDADRSKESIVVKARTPFNHAKAIVDNIKTYPEVPEAHLMYNLDGTYGGTLDKDEYGGGNGLNMGDSLNHTDYNYFNYQDYYNMEDNGTLHICSQYQAFIQTMASSCNCSSILSILNYYKYDFSQIHNNKYIKSRNAKIAGSDRHYSDGTQVFAPIVDGDNGRKQEALVVIYMDRRDDGYFNDLSKKFNNYGGVGASTLRFVPSGLGYTSADTKYSAGSTSTAGGHGYYYRSKYGTSGESCTIFKTYDAFARWCKARISNHYPISVGWNPIGGHWTAIFGFDDMGTDSIYDDVILMADSSDCTDHYVDGYGTYPAQQFYAQWYNSSGSTNQMFVTFNKV